MNPLSTHQELKILYSLIKKDDLVGLQKLFKENPKLVETKNKRKENILFYAFEKDSKKCIDFFMNNHHHMFKEKNILGLNIIHELVIKNKNIDLFIAYFKKLNQSEQNEIYKSHDPNGDNLLMLSAKYSKITIFEKLIEICPNFQLIQKNTNEYGQNIAHLLAIHSTENISTTINKFSPTLLEQEDFISGLTPLMASAHHQDFLNFKSFYDLLPKNQNSYLNNSLTHFASTNNIEIINFLNTEGILSNDKNKLGQTPLMLAIGKGKIDVAKYIYLNLKKGKIINEELILATKLSTKDPVFFKELINNQTNEPFKQENKHKFLEHIFLHSDLETINYLYSHPNYISFFQNLDFGLLSYKAITGKKEMAGKVSFLLDDKNILSTKEVMSLSIALSNLPKNQLLSLLKNTDLINKVNSEDKMLLLSTLLEKNLPIDILDIKKIIKMDDIPAQQTIKNNLKKSKLKLDDGIKNINNWLAIIKDENAVYKYYGKLISQEKDPFGFIEKNIEILSKESIKKLAYYTITEISKTTEALDEKILETLSGFEFIVKDVTENIIKFNKIPKNKEILNIIKSKNFIDATAINSLLEKNKNKNEVCNFIIKYTDFFKLTKENINDLVIALGNNNVGSVIFQKIIKTFPEEEEALVSSYIALNGSGDINKFDKNFISDKFLKSKKIKTAIDENFIKIIETKNDIDPSFMSTLWQMTDIDIIEINMFAQSLLEDNKFKECYNLGLSIGKHFDFKSLSLTTIDWVAINNSSQFNNEPENSFFILLENNKNSISKKQLEDLALGLLDAVQNKNISTKTIGLFFNAFNNDVDKMEPQILRDLLINVLIKYENSNYYTQTINEDSLQDLFENIADKINISLCKEISNSHSELLSETAKIILRKRVLDDSLNNTTDIQINKTKKLKI